MGMNNLPIPSLIKSIYFLIALGMSAGAIAQTAQFEYDLKITADPANELPISSNLAKPLALMNKPIA